MARTRSIVLSLRTKAKMIVGLFLVTKPDVHGERRSKLTDESTSVRSVTAHCADGLDCRWQTSIKFVLYSLLG